ncbi:hypothetical protein M9Y10_018827 [Tritrichomonas musculus]|uniref:Uncharacterized protein n=1 Tax=Tritrichomonas musculus TaxID=1915356 RepID=A0ABR2HI02_9EUKA
MLKAFSFNNTEKLQFFDEFSKKKKDVDVYRKTNVDDAVDVIRANRVTAVKLIANAGLNLSGKDLILQARQITGTNFVCLVFSGSLSHMEWVSKMENVLFTSEFDDFKEFISLSNEYR